MEATGNGTVVELDDVTVGYGRRAVLRRCSLVLGVGLHLVVGPNGAGKTTLFRVVAGILAPWSGLVSVGGRPGRVGPAGLDQVAYVAERPGLPGRLRVVDALGYLDQLRGGPAGSRGARIDHALASAGLAKLAGRRVGELSRGQARRVALAGVALSAAPVVVCDEPTANLDLASAERARADLAALAVGRVVLVASHDPAEADALAPHLRSPLDLVALEAGRVVAQGEPASVRGRVVAGPRRVRLRATGPLGAALDALGVPWEPPGGPGGSAGDRAVVAVGSDAELAALVSELVGAGVGLVEVAPVLGDAAAVAAELSGRPA